MESLQFCGAAGRFDDDIGIDLIISNCSMAFIGNGETICYLVLSLCSQHPTRTSWTRYPCALFRTTEAPLLSSLKHVFFSGNLLLFSLRRWLTICAMHKNDLRHVALSMTRAISGCTFLKMAENAFFLSLFALASLSWGEREVDIFTMRQILRRKWCHRLYNLSS